MSTDLHETDIAARSQHDALRVTVAVGIAHAVLFVISYWLLTTTPGARASDAELVEYYSSGTHRQPILVGLYVMPFAGIAFLWFSVAFRAWGRGSARSWSELHSGMLLVSGVLYVALFFAAAAASSVIAVGVEFSDAPVDPLLARSFPMYGATLLIVFAMRMAATFVVMTSYIGRTTETLPRWFTRAGAVVGLALLLSATFSRALVLVFPIWLLVLCALLLQRLRQTRPPEITR